MKIILISSVAAMVAAGVYGACDFYRDARQGTLIRYDDGQEVRITKTAKVPARLLSGSVTAVAGTAAKQEKKVSVNGFYIDESQFSRASPEFEAEVMAEEAGAPVQAKKPVAFTAPAIPAETVSEPAAEPAVAEPAVVPAPVAELVSDSVIADNEMEIAEIDSATNAERVLRMYSRAPLKVKKERSKKDKERNGSRVAKK